MALCLYFVSKLKKQYKQLRKVQDFCKNCEFDLAVGFSKALSITDLIIMVLQK